MQPPSPRAHRASPCAVALVLAPLALGTGACAGSSAMEEELSRLRREMLSLRKDLAETQSTVQRLESQNTLLLLGRDGVSRTPETAVAARTDEVKRGLQKAPRSKPADSARVLPVVRLSSKAQVDAEQGDDWYDPGALDDGSPPVVIQVGPEEHSASERIPVDRDVLKKPDPVLSRRGTTEAAGTNVPASEATSAEIEAEYSAALARLRKDNKPEEALALFLEFRGRHPRSNLADNAVYWSGECHIALKAYDKAIIELESLVSDFPRSSKRPDALEQIGVSWMALGRPDKAAVAFKQVIESYPKTEAAGRARARLQELGTDGGK